MGLVDDVEGKEDKGEPDDDAPAADGKGKKGPAPAAGKKQHRDNLIIILVGVLGVIVTFLIYRKNQAAAAGSSTTSGAPVNGDVAGGSSDAGGGGNLSSLLTSLEAQEAANGQATAGLTTALGNIQTEIAGLGSGPGPQSSTTTNTTALPYLGPTSGPMNVTPAMGANASNYEQVGYETNGKYAGDQVAGGVPLYAAFGTLGQGGGLYQNFGLKGGPDATYTGPVYAPTADAAYVNYTGPISGAPS